MEPASPPSLATVAKVALQTGLLAFGGSFSVMVRLKRVVVDDHRWMKTADFAEYVAVSSALPGTSATSLLVMIAYRFAGALGVLIGGTLYILPSAIAMVLLARFYEQIRGVQAAASFFDGVGAAVVGLVVAVAVELGKDTLKKWHQVLIAVVAGALLISKLLGLLSVVLLAALVGMILERVRPKPPPLASVAPFVLAGSFGLVLTIFLVFAKIGIATFGGGFAMIPALAHEALSRQWLDETAFSDAIAFGQMTPGPVAISVTFIGYRVAGIPGAIAATLGMFGPPAILAALAARSIHAFRSSAVVRGALAGITPAVVGIIVAAGWHLWASVPRSWLAGAIVFGTALARYVLPRWSPLWALFAGGAITFAASAVSSGRH